MSTQRYWDLMNVGCYLWEIEYVPDDPANDEGDQDLQFIGTYPEAQDFAQRHHPDYLLKEIVFHRGGPAPLVGSAQAP